MRRFVFLSILVITTCLTATSAFSNTQTKQTGQASKLQPRVSEENGELRWVSDDIFTYLRAGPGKDFRLLGSVTAGTKIQLLQVNRDAGYAEIIDDRRRTGWIEIRYVSRKQSIREELNSMQGLLLDKDENVRNMQAKVQSVLQNLNKSDNQKAKLNRQITQQFEELSRLREQLETRELSINIEWFTRGTALGVIALLIGYILGIFGRRRKTDNRLM